jgi:hypothetical protein
MKKKLKILDADIEFISLCPRGKNFMSVLYKEDDGSIELATLVKDDKIDLGQLTTVVYAPGMADADGHFSDAAGVASMCHSYMRNGAKIDIRHNKEALSKEQIYVTECFLAKADDPEFSGIQDKLGRPVNMEGAWVTRFQIDDEELRKEYREGKWDGVSMFGNAKVQAVAKSTAALDIIDLLAERLGTTTDDQEIDMNQTELTALLEKNNEALAKSIVGGITEALKPQEAKPKEVVVEAKKEDKPLEFVGSRTDPKDVQAHLTKVKAHELQKGVDWNDPQSVEEYHAKIAKSDDTDDEGKEGETAVQKEMRILKARIAKADAKSTQNGGGGTELSKEDRELKESADRMVAFMNNEK